MSIRVTRPRLALNIDNFENFAPMYVLDLFKAMIEVGSNIVISVSYTHLVIYEWIYLY